jgi:prepilin-type N-terminal cleavage/methylation domain-containing protein/prepilin-type processing-associated H-X9-DG protein
MDGRMSQPARHSKNHAGFSLIELLVVVAILMILTTMYWGGGKKTQQKKARESCLQNLQKLYISLQIYANENGGKFPIKPGSATAEEPLDLLVPKFTVDTSLFICPASKDQPLASGESLLKGKISYAYFMGRSITDASEPLLCDRLIDNSNKQPGQDAFSTNGKPPADNHGKAGGNFLFCDGGTREVPTRIPFALVPSNAGALLNPRP